MLGVHSPKKTGQQASGSNQSREAKSQTSKPAASTSARGDQYAHAQPGTANLHTLAYIHSQY